MKKKIKLFVLIIVLPFCSVFAQSYAPSDTIVYKNTPQGDLGLHVFYPEAYSADDKRPSLVFFFGGGWVSGNPKQFYQQCSHFAKLGFVCFSAEYRVKSKHKTSPFECVKDGKSAVRFIRTNAKKLGIDPNKIVASGGSAGGHVAVCTGVVDNYDEVGEDLSVSSAPNAMILFNPVLDTSSKGYGAEKVKGRETEISPCHQVKKDMPPCLVFHGTRDKTVPYENAKRFERLMKENCNDCLLVPFFGAGHGFFNSSWFRKINSDIWYKQTMYVSEVFLWKNGFLKEEPRGWQFNQ